MSVRLLVSSRPTIAVRTKENACVLRLLTKYDESAPYQFIVSNPDGQKRLVSGFCFPTEVPDFLRMGNLLLRVEELLNMDVGTVGVRDSIYDYGTKLHVFVAGKDNIAIVYLGTTEIGRLEYSNGEIDKAVWRVDVGTSELEIVEYVKERIRLLPENAVAYSKRIAVYVCGWEDKDRSVLIEPEHADRCFDELSELIRDHSGMVVLEVPGTVKLVSDRFRFRLMERFLDQYDPDTFNNRFLLSYFN